MLPLLEQRGQSGKKMSLWEKLSNKQANCAPELVTLNEYKPKTVQKRPLGWRIVTIIIFQIFKLQLYVAIIFTKSDNFENILASGKDRTGQSVSIFT